MNPRPREVTKSFFVPMNLYEQIPSLLYEFSIIAAQEKLLILPRLLLNANGFKNTDISETSQQGGYCLKVFIEQKTRLKVVKKLFEKIPMPGVRHTSKALRSKEWLTRWKKQWKPLCLTKTIDVVPFWYKNRYKSKKSIIYLDTLMSFGTGLHETTQLISQLIQARKNHLGDVLDIGTGTGILALVALRNGADSVTVMDISPLSIEAAKKNFKVNHQKANFILGDIASLPAKQKYDTVAANLITDDLLRFRLKIIALVKPGGHLFISGISLDNLMRLTKGYKSENLQSLKVRKGKQWAAIHYVKKMS